MTTLKSILTVVQNQITNRPIFVGLFAAVAVVFVWSGWIVVSRQGVTHELSIWDLSLLRFATASLAVTPFLLAWKVRFASLFQPKVAIPALASGQVYVTLSFAGLQSSPAANAGIVVNGLLPVATLLILIAKRRFELTRSDAIACMMVLFATLMLRRGEAIELREIVFFAGAALSLSFYMVQVKDAALDARTLFLAIPIVNATFAVPLWLVLDGGLTASATNIAIQAGYQGILVSIIAIGMLTFAVRKMGSIAVSLVLSAVPSATALLAYVFLKEPLNPAQFWALGIATAALSLQMLKVVPNGFVA